jgi:Tfp pilus assembly protein PilO
VKTEQRQKTLAIVAIAVVGLLACDRLVFTPLGNLWTSRSQRIASLSKQLNDGAVLQDRAHLIRQRWVNMRSNTLPNNVSVAEIKVVNAVNHWVTQSGISFTSIKPQWKQNADNYMTLECQADGYGDLSSVTRFLYELERDPLALRVENVDISARDTNGQQLTLGVRFTGLVLTGTKP